MINKEELIGVWKANSNKEYGHVTLDFKPDGNLIYTIFENNKEQIIKLIYWIEGEYICTDQPSSPGIEKTKGILIGNSLTLNFNGIESVYSKIQ